MQDDVDTLLRDAEYEAERIVAIARIAVALWLLLFFILTVTPPTTVPEHVAGRMWEMAVAVLLTYLVLSVLTWFSVRRRWFRRWMILPAALLDVYERGVEVNARRPVRGREGEIVIMAPDPAV